MDNPPNNRIERPPVVVVMGHVDHGKSSLLDYIRNANTIAHEAGGITQHIGAYEVTKEHNGVPKRITFIDTPGHEAFSKMRSRGAQVADIAVLVVAANDGVKAQTIEALETIIKNKVPYVVAVNKIDINGADPDRVKQELAEREIFVEGYGGSIPAVAISAKKGTGVDELLEMILLMAEMEELRGDPARTGEGVVIESHLDPKKGSCATLVIKDGTITKPCFIVAGSVLASVRTMITSNGSDSSTATFSSPVQVTGWTSPPPVGEIFSTYNTKREAEAAVCAHKQDCSKVSAESEEGKIVIPVIIKADVSGSLEAISEKICSLSTDKVLVKIIGTGIGAISENDARLASGSTSSMIIGFNVKMDSAAKDVADQFGIRIMTNNIIYKISEELEAEILKQTPKVKTEVVTGRATVLKIFATDKNKVVIGGVVSQGALRDDSIFRVLRDGETVGHGKVLELQQQKIKCKEVTQNTQFGSQVEVKSPINERDVLEVYVVEEH